jgi:putative FmdB family regulatory protein
MMQVFDYQCDQCHYVLERMVRAEEKDVPHACPACEHGWLRRKPAATRTTFKFADKSGFKR